MNISLVPLDIYKIPKHCSDVLVAQNFLYTVQHVASEANETANFDTEPGKNYDHAIGVVSGSFSNLNICEEAVITVSGSLFALRSCKRFLFLFFFRNLTSHRTLDIFI